MTEASLVNGTGINDLIFDQTSRIDLSRAGLPNLAAVLEIDSDTLSLDALAVPPRNEVFPRPLEVAERASWPAVDSEVRGRVANVLSRDYVQEPITAENLASAIELAGLCFNRQSDLEQIVREYQRIASGENVYYEPRLDHLMQIQGDFVFTRGGVPAAMSGVYQYPEEPDRMWLSWFGVHPEFRGNGLGGQVLRQMEEFAAEKGAKVFAAYTEDEDNNARCHKFYEDAGYKVVAKFSIDDELLRVYQKSL